MTDSAPDTGMGPDEDAPTTRRTRRTRRLTAIGVLALVLVAGATFAVVRGTVGNTSGSLTSGSASAWVSPLAGLTQRNYGLVDGTGIDAKFRYPTAVATVGNTGVVYVADTGNNRVRKVVNPTPNSDNIYGTGGGTNGKGVVTTIDVAFNAPEGLAVTSAGTTLYVADTGNGRVRRLDLTVTPPAVTDVVTGLNRPTGLALDSAGTTLYVAVTNSNVVKKIDLSTTPVTVTTLPTNVAAATGFVATTLYYPTGLSVDGAGNVYVIDERDKNLGQSPERDPSKTIKRYTPGATSWQVVVSAYYLNPVSLAVNSAGTVVYFTDDTSWSVVRASVGSTTGGSTIAGVTTRQTGAFANDHDGRGDSAGFYSPTGIALSADGTTIYVASSASSRVVYIR